MWTAVLITLAILLAICIAATLLSQPKYLSHAPPVLTEPPVLRLIRDYYFTRVNQGNKQHIYMHAPGSLTQSTLCGRDVPFTHHITPNVIDPTRRPLCKTCLALARKRNIIKG